MTPRLLLRSLVAREPVLAVLVGAVVGLALLLSGLGGGAEKAGSDLRAGFALHPASGEVVVVEIDARSIAALHHWPWPRSVHAAMVDRLRASGAKLIAFDVDFSSASDPQEDAALAASLRRAGGGVLLPTFRQEVAFSAGGTVESAPIRPLADNGFLAAANVQPDADGALRRMPYGVDILGAPRPSLAAMLAERPGEAEAQFGIDLHLDPATLPRFSAVDLIEGRIPAARLAGKRVIVGGTAVELGDRYTAPGFAMLPGVLIQAMAAETLLTGRAYRDVSAAWPLLLALALLPTTLRPGRGGSRAALVAAGAALFLFLPLLLERQAHATVAVVPALGALLAGAAGAALKSFALRYRLRGLTDRETGLPNLAALIRDGRSEATLTIGAVRIGRIAERMSSGGADDVRAQILRLAERLRFAAGASAVYRTGTDALVWRMAEPAPGDDPLTGIARLLRAAQAGEEGADLQLHFGIASGPGANAAAVAASAALAAEQAATKGIASHVFTTADADAVRRDEALLARFEAALSEGRIHCAYQLKRDLRTGRPKGVEALARWNDAEFGAVPPDVFIPLLERYGGIVDLTAAILGEALVAAAAWNALDASFSVAVNLSATLLQDAGAMLRLRQMFLASGLPGAALIVEVTETAAMSDPERAIAGLAAWRDLGVSVSIDDYGTGHSSLTYLQRLPATELKIDGSFVKHLAADPRSAIMVRSTIAMAHELGLEIVAEGVEDRAVLELLRTMGCDIAQGWAVGRPAPAGDIGALLLRESGGTRKAS